MAHSNLSPRAKCQVSQISVFKKGSTRNRRMVMAELMKKQNELPATITSFKEKENVCSSTPIRHLKRTRAEDHVFDANYRSDDITFRKTFKPRNDRSPPSGTEHSKSHYMADSVHEPGVASQASEPKQQSSLSRERHAWSAGQQFRHVSPTKVTNVIKQPSSAGLQPSSAGYQESPSPCRVPSHRIASQICVQDNIVEQQSRIFEESRSVDNMHCSNSNVASPPPMTRIEQNGFPSPPNCYGNLLRSVGSPEISTSDRRHSCSPLRLQAERNVDSEPVKQRPGLRAESPELVAPPNFHGLWNLGNTCYMNAIIQLLYFLDCFNSDISYLERYRLRFLNDGIFNALRQVFGSIFQAGPGAVISPSDLQSSCEKYMTDFCGSVQQDAQEFLLNILDKIEGEIMLSTQRAYSNSTAPPPSQESLCPITKNFSCQVRNVLSCEACDCSLNVEQSCRHFSLPLPEDRRDSETEVPDIEALLDLYFQVETVSRKCEKCGSETMKSETKIVQIPRVLVLHINRFEIDRHMLCSKVSVPVKFGESLDLGKWCSDKVRGACDFGSKRNGGQDVLDFTDHCYTSNGYEERLRERDDHSEQICNGVARSPSVRVDAQIGHGVISRTVNGVETRISNGVAGTYIGKRGTDGQISNGRVVEQTLKGGEEERISRQSVELKYVHGLERKLDDGVQEEIVKDEIDKEEIVKDDIDKEEIGIRDVKPFNEELVEGIGNGGTEPIGNGRMEEEIGSQRMEMIGVKRLLEKTENEEMGKHMGYGERERIGNGVEQHMSCEVRLDNSSSRGSLEDVAGTTMYKLHGVVSHVGKLASCGHYTVDIFDGQSGKWVRCDDSHVREVMPGDVFSEEKSAEAYVLLYTLCQ